MARCVVVIFYAHILAPSHAALWGIYPIISEYFEFIKIVFGLRQKRPLWGWVAFTLRASFHHHHRPASVELLVNLALDLTALADHKPFGRFSEYIAL